MWTVRTLTTALKCTELVNVIANIGILYFISWDIATSVGRYLEGQNPDINIQGNWVAALVLLGVFYVIQSLVNSITSLIKG